MGRKRHRLDIEDFENVIRCCADGDPDSILDSLLTPQEVAQILHLKLATVISWTCEKKPDIPHVRISSKVRFPKHWLSAWAKKRQEALKKWRFEL